MICDEFDPIKLTNYLVNEVGDPSREDILDMISVYSATAQKGRNFIDDFRRDIGEIHAYTIEALLHIKTCEPDKGRFEDHLSSIDDESKRLAYQGKEKFEKRLEGLNF